MPDVASWTVEDLRLEAARYVAQAQAAGLAASTVQTYDHQTAQFIRWLAGDYTPHGPQSSRA